MASGQFRPHRNLRLRSLLRAANARLPRARMHDVATDRLDKGPDYIVFRGRRSSAQESRARHSQLGDLSLEDRFDGQNTSEIKRDFEKFRKIWSRILILILNTIFIFYLYSLFLFLFVYINKRILAYYSNGFLFHFE